MQTTIGATPADRKYPAERKGAGRHLPWNNHTKKNHHPTCGTSHDFLRTTFSPIPATEYYPVFNRKNYNHLLQSVKNYSNLLGSSFDFKSSVNDFTGLHAYFEKILPKEQGVRLTEENGKLFFKIGFGHDFLMHEVYFIPIEILNKTEGILRDIILAFFQHFQQAYHLPKIENMYDYEMIVDNYEEWYDREDDPGLWDFLRAYRDGYISDTFNLLYAKPNYSLKDLRKLTRKYKAKTDREKQLAFCIKQGINIMEMNKNFLSYVQPPDFPEEDENGEIDYSSAVEAERMIRFVYAPYDMVSENYLTCINTDAGEFGNEYFPRKSLLITPDTCEILEVDFIECFFTWLQELNEILYNYD